jgi:hypothetical protein
MAVSKAAFRRTAKEEQLNQQLKIRRSAGGSKAHMDLHRALRF